MFLPGHAVLGKRNFHNESVSNGFFTNGHGAYTALHGCHANSHSNVWSCWARPSSLATSGIVTVRLKV